MNPTDVDDVPEAEPLPALDETEKAAAAPAEAAEEGAPTTPKEEQEEGAPPLPPLMELAGSNISTAGGLAYGAAGLAGLLAVGAVATVGGAAYLAKDARDRRDRAAQRGGTDPGRRGFRSLARGAGAAGRGALGGARGRGAAGGLAGRGRGGAGTAGSAGRRFGAASGGLGRKGGPGAGPRGALGGGRGGGAGLLGRSGGSSGAFGRSGGSSGSAGRWGGAGGGSRSGLGGRSGGAGLLGGSRAGSGSRGLFGAARRRSGGRVTAISDPAVPTRTSGRRPLRGALGAMRRGWNHPRMRGGRVRFKRASERTRDYMRKRSRRLRTTALWHSLAGWWGRLWGRIRGDDRYGPMSSASTAASALAVAALGPSRRRSAPRRVITGRVIGTSARTPGEISSARKPLAIGAGASGTEEGHPMRKPGEIIRAETAADEMQAALAAFGGADVHMLTYEQGLIALPQLLRRIGVGLGQMSASAEGEQPLDPAVVEFMHQISAAVHQVSDVAEELPGLFRAAHQSELELLEDRRPHAERWDRSRRDS